jgi:single-stranded-DNA-specific exonuclease
MRGITRRWIISDPIENTSQPSPADLPPIVARILHTRGLADADSAARFCQPKLTDLHDPSLMPNIDAAAERLVHAIRADQSIVIYGDYDVDGVTASAILFHVIRALKPDARVSIYTPHRVDEGYGLNTPALKQIHEQGADLVVSVDCGVTATEPAAAARALGLDLIITDHHNLPAGDDEPPHLPDALIVHPRLPESAYPYGELCGAGVAFKLAWRLATCWAHSERVGEALQKRLLDMLPLVALATIADVVPLLDENRILVKYGLQLIKRTPIEGLQALIEASNLAGENICPEKVGFILAPRLNACGRMGHAEDAVRLLTTAAGDEARTLAASLTALNRQRQKTEQDIAQHAAQLAIDSGMTEPDCRAIVLAHESWHPGVIGIVCSRLIHKFGRPTLLMQIDGGACKGSGRSIDGFSLHTALAACSEHLATFGGHDAAAGLSLPLTNLPAFTAAFRDYANAHITIDELVPPLRIDCDAVLDELNPVAVERLQTLGPFGQGNRKPTIRVAHLTVAEPPKQIGAQGKHLALRLLQDDHGRRRMIRCLWWGEGSRAVDFAAGMKLEAAIEPKINTWKGRSTVEAEIRDLRLQDA